MRRWRKENPEAARVKDRAKYRRNKLGARDLQLRVKFGITLDYYESLRGKQDNKCAICATAEPRGRGDWHVDHDHDTGIVRGLLCHNCNVGLGNFRDSVAFLKSAIKYLQNHKKQSKLKTNKESNE